MNAIIKEQSDLLELDGSESTVCRPQLLIMNDEQDEITEEIQVDDGYWAVEETTVMVPVKVQYHHVSNVVHSFDLPTRETIEEILSKQ